MKAMRTASNRVTTDIAVVGAGPAGLFAALALAQTGLRVALIAGEGRPQHDHRTTALLGGSVLALDKLGVWPLCEGKAQPLRTMRIVDDTGRLLRAPLLECRSDEINLPAFGYNLANDDLVAALETRLASSPVTRMAGTITSMHCQGEQVSLEGDAGLSITASLVVAADGRTSRLREWAGISVHKRDYPQVAVTLNITHRRPHHDISTEFHTQTGPFTLVPLPGNRSSVVCVVNEAEANRLISLEADELSHEMERRSHSILGKVKVEPGFGRFPLGLLTARRFAQNRIVLVGEAAHVVPPIGAQGLNLGLRDGASLLDCVQAAMAQGEDIGGVKTLDAYHHARFADIASRETAINLLNRSLLSDFLPVTALRGGGLWAMDRIGPLRRLFMREGLQPGFAVPGLMKMVSQPTAD